MCSIKLCSKGDNAVFDLFFGISYIVKTLNFVFADKNL